MSSHYEELLLSDTQLKEQQANIVEFYDKNIIKHQIKNPQGLILSAVELAKNSDDCLVIIPGRGEIAHKYAELLYSLRNENKRIVILFVRGQGQSSRLLPDKQRCHIDKFCYFREDISFLLKKLNIKSYKLLAFSLGSLISLDVILNSDHPPLKAALLAPYIYPYFPLPRFILSSLIMILGSLPFINKCYTPHGKNYKRVPFDSNYHSHSETRFNYYHDYYALHKNLTIGGPTWRFLREAYICQKNILKGQFKFKIPVMAILSGADKVVSTDIARKFFLKHLNDNKGMNLITVDNAYHDLLNEADQYRIQSLPQALNFLDNGV